jgi:TetR/AcrR family transcriptional regulator, transcriptional repressor for nem operon
MVFTFEISSITVSKAEQTKQRIIEKAAILFNQNGYAGSSINDIMKLTGLQKGGIYNHFKSKDEIALAAFDHTVDLLKQTVLSEVLTKTHSIDRLHALVSGFKGFTQTPTIIGGCPILNTAVESDDTHPALRFRAQQAVGEIRALIESIVELGIRQQEIIPTADANEIAIIIISTLEGAIMLSKLYGTDMYLDKAMKHLHQYVKNYSL